MLLIKLVIFILLPFVVTKSQKTQNIKSTFHGKTKNKAFFVSEGDPSLKFEVMSFSSYRSNFTVFG